jgi:hypothetical protein
VNDRWREILRAAAQHPWGISRCHANTAYALRRRGLVRISKWRVAIQNHKYVQVTDAGRKAASSEV